MPINVNYLFENFTECLYLIYGNNAINYQQ